MRETEIAAMRDEFFSDEFDYERAKTMLGSLVAREQHGDDVVTTLRPDARSLAQVELYSEPDDPRGAAGFVHRVRLVLRSPQLYSRETLETVLGAGQLAHGPSDPDEGVRSLQMVFEAPPESHGSVTLRWWPRTEDPTVLRDTDYSQQLRVDEIWFERLAIGTLSDDEYDLDEALDNASWIADTAWRVLRPTFGIQHVAAFFAEDDQSVTRQTEELLVVRPRDPRFELILVAHRGEWVASVRLQARGSSPLSVAVDVVADRLNSSPQHHPGLVRFAVEATRDAGASGTVTLMTIPDAAESSILSVAAIDVVRG